MLNVDYTAKILDLEDVIVTQGTVLCVVFFEFFRIFILQHTEPPPVRLIKNHHISSSTVDKLRKNKPVNSTTINDLCRIFDCPVEEIIRYIPSEDDQKL